MCQLLRGFKNRVAVALRCFGCPAEVRDFASFEGPHRRLRQPAPALRPRIGDCNTDQQVTVDDVLTMATIALGSGDVSPCQAGDANHDRQIIVDEILAGVNHAPNGCPK